MDKFSPTPEMPESVRDVIDRARALGSLSGFALDSWLGTLAATAFDAGRQSVSSERGEFTVDEICLMIQNAVSDYTRRTPGHLRDCDMLTGHIVHAFRNAAPQVLAMATSGASGQNVEVDRAGRPSGVSPALCDERPAGGSNPADAGPPADTPRTNAFFASCTKITGWNHLYSQQAAFARGLERELSALRLLEGMDALEASALGTFLKGGDIPATIDRARGVLVKRLLELEKKTSGDK